jgi:hypothetical protein
MNSDESVGSPDDSLIPYKRPASNYEEMQKIVEDKKMDSGESLCTADG